MSDVEDEEIVWAACATSDAEVMNILALGFVCLIATGAHLRHYHLAIVRRRPVYSCRT